MKRKKSPSADLDTLMPILMGIWRRFHKEGGPSDKLQTREFRRVVDAVVKLQQQSDGERSLLGQDYFKNPDMLGAYLLYQWVVHYQEGLTLIGELPNPPKRVLDVCSGPAPYAFAALRHGAKEVFATDRNQTALQLGAEVSGRYGMALNVRQWDCLRQTLPIEGKFDLIIVAHCLEELFPPTIKDWKEKQYNFLGGLMKRLSPEGYLMVVDNSYPEANKRILMLRDHMVLKEQVPVQAPCVWKGECVALQSNSLCYAQREFEKPYIVKEIQRSAQINLNSLKMSYVIFRNPGFGWPHLPDRKMYRVISPPVDSFHGKRFYLCGTDGKKNLGSHVDELPTDARAFDYLKRGELISIEDALEKEHSYDIIQGTKIHVEAAVGKPTPEIEKEDEY
jgi:2-polyprenyl-3-methyl-5-hydroxy-6-metoxy-1,4-benzoquinol methylase